MDEDQDQEQPQSNELQPWYIPTLTQLACALGLSVSKVSGLAAQRGFPSMEIGGRKYYDPVAVAAFCAYSPKLFKTPYRKELRLPAHQIANTPVRKGTAEDDYSEQIAAANSPALERKRIAEAQLKELELAKERGQLVDKQSFEDDEIKRYMMAKNRFLKLPLELSARLENLTAKEIQDELEHTIREAVALFAQEVADEQIQDPPELKLDTPTEIESADKQI